MSTVYNLVGLHRCTLYAYLCDECYDLCWYVYVVTQDKLNAWSVFIYH